MARIRTIKPEFWQNETLAELSAMTRLLAIGLLNHADDEGYFKANPALIRAAIFPFDDSANVPGMLQELSDAGYLRIRQGEDGKAYGWVVTFLKHQRVDKPKKSEIKDLCDFRDDSKNDPRIVPDESKLEGKGKEQGTGNREQGKDPGADAPDFHAMFSTLWDSWPKGYGDKGSRKQAESAFLKLKPDKTLFAEILRAMDAQAQDKASKAASGQFFSNFKHVERWIRNREWENEIAQFTARPAGKISKSDEADRAAAAYLASLEDGDSGSASHAQGNGVDYLPAGQH